MLNFQVTLSQFRCRKNQFNLQNDQNVVIFRFGTIKLDIKIIQSHNGYFGGKRIVLDLSEDQLQEMFNIYAIGMFIENQYGKFFSILSLQKLKIHDIISKHEVYFYNDQQEVIYQCNFSLNLKSLKNPRLPNNKQKIQNHKTFQQFFTKPPIPQNKPINNYQTMTSFLYGNRHYEIKSQKNIGKVSTQIKNKAKTTVKPSKTGQNWNKKTGNIPLNSYMNTQQHNYTNYNNNKFINNNNTYQQSLDDDINPPAMQFTNKQQQDPRQKVNLLQTQLRQLNNAAPEYIKFQTVMNNTNAFSKNKQNKTNHFALTSKINEKLDSQQRQSMNMIHSNSKIQNNSYENIKIDRQQLKNKAKKQLQSYQSNNNVKIPIFKNGKYQYVDISNLNDQQIKKFALQQKALQQEQKQKLLFAQRLQQKQKQNLKLKKQLQQKQRLMVKKQQQVNKKQYELMMQTKKNKQLQNLKKQQQKSNISSNNNKNKYEDSYDQSKSQYQDQDQQQQQNQQKSDDQQQQYEQDFESQSQAMSQLKSRLSIQSSQHKKQQQSYSYDSNDFESFSQSLLDSQKRLSQDEIDNAPSYKQVLRKKYGY